ncbi:putative nucleotidyltransferase, ribonuclease H [Tanacetum coccineum]|uniref:Nucleotidyltransferase, ribonuclease H n=1 Tax=Tanacetum coccineum TaxID=301880 RepID=A0ABQ5AXW7_9ASTR
MVNTRTDAKLAAVVQAPGCQWLPRDSRQQVREEYRTGAVDFGFTQLTDILRDRDAMIGPNVPDKRNTFMNSGARRDTKEKRFPAVQGTLEGYIHPVCNTLDVYTPESVVPCCSQSPAPYRMAPIELKELKDQLQELFEREGNYYGNGKQVRAITKGQDRRLLTEVRNFLGLVRIIHRRIVEGYSRLALPLTILIEKGGFQIYNELLRRVFAVDPSALKICETYLYGRIHGDKINTDHYRVCKRTFHSARIKYETETLVGGNDRSGIMVEEETYLIIRDLERLDIELCVRGQSGFWASLRVEPNLISQIKTAQKDDGEIWAIIQNIDQQTEFRVDDDGILWQGTKLCVPEDPTLREALMTEAHSSPFSIHPGSTKMYHDLKQHFWWSGMKRDVATFVSKCLTCQQVKIEHQRASGLLQPLEIPVWKWDEISMDFVTGLPRTQRKHDAIWVVVDRLTKSAHFLPIRKDYPVSKLAEMFQQEIVRLHGTPSAIVSDRDPRFTSRFWKGLQKAWGTRLKFSTAFHPETDGQSERTIQTLEDMLRSCALEWAGNWDDYICLVEFAYNNSWHASIKWAPFEMLYGRKCRAPICWDQVGERILEGPEMIEVTNEKVVVAREKLKEAQTRQKSYADRHRRALEFQPGEHVFLKVSPTRGVRLVTKGKAQSSFQRPFEDS